MDTFISMEELAQSLNEALSFATCSFAISLASTLLMVDL